MKPSVSSVGERYSPAAHADFHSGAVVMCRMSRRMVGSLDIGASTPRRYVDAVTAYALLLRPAANRVYTKGAASLGAAELTVLGEDVLNGALQGVAHTAIAGVDYVGFETASPLARTELAILANHSSALALFEISRDS